MHCQVWGSRRRIADRKLPAPSRPPCGGEAAALSERSQTSTQRGMCGATAHLMRGLGRVARSCVTFIAGCTVSRNSDCLGSNPRR